MLKYKDGHLRFMEDFKVPYTNNATEKHVLEFKFTAKCQDKK